MSRISLRTPLFVLTGCLFLASAAGADWLITLEGESIETQGPWTIEGETLTYADAAGEEHRMALADVDLEASKETTALKAGKTYVPEPKPEEPAAEAPAEGPKAAAGEPKVVLYMTSWCGYCRRTGQLLTALGVPFVAKDVEKDRQAAKEYRKKAGGYRGIPVLDVDGRIVRGFRPTLIHKYVAELQEKEAKAAKAAGGGS